ncbi:MAG: hypothetical protein KGL46_11790 [Hyphomicrobiales bacterium]|nr:hypothetical protein [Hyphomicrobiales bacterium]
MSDISEKSGAAQPQSMQQQAASQQPAQPMPTHQEPAQPAPARAQQAAPQSAARRRIFVSDRPRASDTPAPQVARLAELIARRDAEGPMSIAILGGPGAGKTHALAELVDAAALASTASQPAKGAFQPAVVALRLEAADLTRAPETVIAERLHMRLSRDYPALDAAAADEALHAGADPRRLAQALNEKLDEGRKRVDEARIARADAESRRARLTETALYETAGTRVDAFARSNRGAIESALRGFGFRAADLTQDFKGLVQSFAETGGPFARALASFRALWAYKGQPRLIFWIIVLLALAWIFGALADNPAWLSPVQNGPETLRPAGDWIAQRLSWFSTAQRLCDYAALACLAVLLWRALRFTQLLWRGADALDADILARKGDLDQLIAHHAQRAEMLAGETEALAAQAAEAEKRAGGAYRAGALPPAFVGAEEETRNAARAYLAALDALAQVGARPAPPRIVVSIDSADQLAPEQGLAVLAAANAALAYPLYALVAAFDPGHFARAGGAAALERIVQIPLRIDAGKERDWERFVAHLATGAPVAAPGVAPATRIALDAPLSPLETKLLGALAPLAGPSPRGVKRFVNLYRLARPDAPENAASLALMLALQTGGARDEKEAVERALVTGADAAPFVAPTAGPRVQAALKAVEDAQGRPPSVNAALRAYTAARIWSL